RRRPVGRPAAAPCRGPGPASGRGSVVRLLRRHAGPARRRVRGRLPDLLGGRPRLLDGPRGGRSPMTALGGSSGPLRVVLADDEPLVRAGLAGIIGTDEALRVVAEASSGQEALAAVRAHRPDVVLLDVRMGQMNGLAALAEIR